jgi:dimethylglycine dehydrogenase
MTAFAKCRISGPGAESFLDYMIANRLPQNLGGISLCHALNKNGGVHSEFTIRRDANESFYLVSAGALQRLDHDYLKKHFPGDDRCDRRSGSRGPQVAATLAKG